MVDIKKLRDAIVRSGYTIDELSKMIGMDDSTFYRKINADGKTFTIAQADALAKTLKLNAGEAQSIFFGV